MEILFPKENKWKNLRIGITGAKGTFGTSLANVLSAKGAVIVGLTHGDPKTISNKEYAPEEWVQWKCGDEFKLQEILSTLDILIINHGKNHQGGQSYKDLTEAIEINALSSWRLIESFKLISIKESNRSKPREVWINTSEAEIQPALSPAYELSKRLIGQLVSISWNNLSKDEANYIKIKKLVLGPFRSELNPIGLMESGWVAKQVVNQANLGFNLIIVTPNPITYLLMPLVELTRSIYYKLFNK